MQVRNKYHRWVCLPTMQWLCSPDMNRGHRCVINSHPVVLFSANLMILFLRVKAGVIRQMLKGSVLMTSSVAILRYIIMTSCIVPVLHVAAALSDTLILESLIQRGAVVKRYRLPRTVRVTRSVSERPSGGSSEYIKVPQRSVLS